MKNKFLTKILGATLGLAMAIGVGVGVAANNKVVKEVNADTTTTYVFQNASWNAKIGNTNANWTSGKAGAGFQNNGIQVTTAATGAYGTSPTSFTNVSRVVLTYNTNKSGGAGTASVQIGSNDAVVKDWAYSSGDGRTANYTLTYNFSPNQTGKVKVTLETTANSIYLVSCAITEVATGPSVTNVAKKTAPTKTSYYQGEEFDPSGLVVTVSYSEGDPEDIAYNDHPADFTWSPLVVSAAGNIEIQYKDNSSMKVTQAVTLVTPMTVTEAIAAIEADGDHTIPDSYVSGKVSKVDSYSSTYHSITYWISVDGTTSNQLQVYGGHGLNKANFNSIDDVDLLADVVIRGDLKKFGDVYEFDKDNYLLAYVAPVKTLNSIELSGTYPTTFYEGDDFSHEGMVVTASYSNGATKNVVSQATFSGYNMATAGVYTVTVSFTDGVEKTATYSITVKARLVVDYKKYNGATVVEGDYIIYYDGKAAKNTTSTNRVDYSTATPTNNIISTKATNIVWHIAKAGDYYTIYNKAINKYLAATGSWKQAQLIEDGTDDKAKWTVTSPASGTYEFENLARSNADSNNTYKWLRNNGTYGFACYATGTGGALSLYKKTAKSEIEALSTRAALSYSYSQIGDVYSYSDVKIRFGGLITEAMWNALNSESAIQGYGVMISTSDPTQDGYIGNNTFRSEYEAVLDAAEGNVDEALDALCDNVKIFNFFKAGAPTKLLAAEDDRIEENTYVWNLSQTVTAPTNLKRTYVAVAYIRTNAGIVLLDEARESAKSLAQKMITGPSDPAFGGSLANLANLA